MGKSSSKIIERLVMRHQPVRYVVTNTEKVILVTYDYKFALKIAENLYKLENPKNYYPRIR